MSERISRRGFVALGGALLFGGALAGTALAQQGTETPWTCPMGFGTGPRVGAGPWSGGGPDAGPVGQAGTMHQVLADALGMSTDELFAAQRSGKTIAQLAQEKGVDFETVVTAVLEAHDKALEAQVAAGRLTREQADWMDAHMEANIRAMLAGQHGPGMMGGPGFGVRGPGFASGMGPAMMPGMGPGRRGPGNGPGSGPPWQGR
jgi:hypothetical protein